MRLKINNNKPNEKIIDEVINIFNNGGVVIYPTDTIYGLGCDASNVQAVKKIQKIKGRSQQTPFSIICPDLKNISQLALVSNSSYRLIKKYLPGPFTFILPATKLVPKLVQHPKTKTVGIRMPNHYFCLALMKKYNQPIVTTSVNKHGEAPNQNPDIIENDWSNKVNCIVDAGILEDAASTIVDLTNDTPIILRQGKGIFLEV